MPPLTHEQVWSAIDRLAERYDLSPSGLARRAGLDSTTFNKSKRLAADGRARWPSTESVAKVIEATGATMDDFVAMMDGQAQALGFGESRQRSVRAGAARRIPLLGLAQAGGGGYFDDAGYPAGDGWDHVAFPEAGMGEHVYALEISGESMEPLYRAGDRVIVSPTATIRRGDRVVVKTRDGEVMAKILKRRAGGAVELASANPDFADRTVATDELEWMARILWASQ